MGMNIVTVSVVYTVLEGVRRDQMRYRSTATHSTSSERETGLMTYALERGMTCNLWRQESESGRGIEPGTESSWRLSRKWCRVE